MSGIAGIIRFDGAPIEPGHIERMTGAMAYRGPDGINHWARGSVALGQCMLRTTAESLEETQPLTNEDESLVLTMDGRVDNWEDLRSQLLARAAVLRNRSDAELVLRAYEVWGRDCLRHIDGDFALVIWDARRQEAFCARDRMGNKPLNYHWDGKTLIFASEVRAILTMPSVREDLNEGMVAEFLAAKWYCRDETFWKGILRLIAAHRMVVDAAGPRLKEYWAPDLWSTLAYTNEEDYIDHYRELLDDIVRRASRSHRPVAYEVSGGLDSSAVFCIGERLRSMGRLTTPAINGYTLAFPDDELANELEYGRAVGTHLGLPIYEIAPSLVPLSWYYQRAQTDREFPAYPNGAMSLGLRQQSHAQGARVILSGVGGDEWLGDCRQSRAYYAEELTAGRWPSWLEWVKSDVRDYGAVRTLGWFLRFGVTAQLSQPAQVTLWQAWRWLRGRGERLPQWLSSDLQVLLAARKEAHRPVVCPIRRLGQLAQLLTLADSFSAWAVESEERMSARIGLDLRHPMRDPTLVNFSFKMPARLLVRGRINKYAHVRAMEGLLPEKLLVRKTKAEFSVVFRHQLGNIAEVLKDILKTEQHWFNARQVEELYHSYENGKTCKGNMQVGNALWVLSGIIGCDAITNQRAA